MATAADGDGDGSVFEMGFNNGNDAAIADDVRHGRTAPFSVRATAAAKETTKVLRITIRSIDKGLVNSVGHISLVQAD